MVKLSDIITFSRLLLAPFLLYFVFYDQKIEAVIVLCIITASDWLDGFIARKRKESSRSGHLLDKGIDYFLASTLIPALIYIRTENVYVLLISPILLIIGAIYLQILIKNKKMSGTILGKPLMTGMVFISYLVLILDFYWKYFLSALSIILIVNIILFLQGKYRK